VEHERESLRGLEGLQHHEEREADRVGEHRIGLRIPVGAGDHRIGYVRGILTEGILPARCPRPQHVQAHTRDDGREPGAQVHDVVDIGPAEANPAFLDRILGFARRPEHPIRYRAQMRPVPFELFGEPLPVSRNALTAFLRVSRNALTAFLRRGHRSHSSVAIRHGSDGPNVDDVTEPAFAALWRAGRRER
jgi:hypothetical protein